MKRTRLKLSLGFDTKTQLARRNIKKFHDNADKSSMVSNLQYLILRKDLKKILARTDSMTFIYCYIPLTKAGSEINASCKKIILEKTTTIIGYNIRSWTKTDLPIFRLLINVSPTSWEPNLS